MTYTQTQLQVLADAAPFEQISLIVATTPPGFDCYTLVSKSKGGTHAKVLLVGTSEQMFTHLSGLVNRAYL